MLGKIMKHEFKATWKYFLLIDFITLVLGIISFVVCYGVAGIIDDIPVALAVFLVLCLLGYFFAIVAAALLTTGFNTVRYYRSLYSAEGYLTFTLPASTVEIVSAKILVAFIWQLLMSICVSICVMLTLGGFFTYGWFHNSISIQDFFNSYFVSLEDLFGMNELLLLTRYFISGLLQLLLNLMMFFFAISIGQLWQKHKIIGSIVAYFGTRTAFGVFSFMISLLTGTFGMLFASDSDPSRYFSHTTLVSILTSMVLCVGMYIVCVWIPDKKLNLD